MRAGISGLLIAAAAAVAAPAAACCGISEVYVFGDSFADSGNANIGTAGLAANAAQGYYKGRFGDGYNFADYVSKRLTGHYATPFLAGGNNFAVGGSRASSDYVSPDYPPLIIPGLTTEQTYYAGKYPSVAPPFFTVDPAGLYIVEFGNNDVNAIQANPAATAAITAAYVTNMMNAVLALNAGGATRIAVLGVPNPGEAEGIALQAALDLSLDAITPFLKPSLTLTRFDFFDFFTRVQARPNLYGLPTTVDFTTPCLAAVAAPAVPNTIDCTGYFSFDGIHVTQPVQLEIARELLTQAGLPTVPEPSSWALMIGGFGLIGTALRRRRSSPTR